MNMIGKLFSRIATITTFVILALVIALPLNASVLAAAAFVPDDFNRCSLDTGVWTFENPGGTPEAKITGQYTGDSVFEIPVDRAATFSSTRGAPRIMQPAADADFDLEVRFNSPLGAMTGDRYHMQGILIHDAASNKWLRFDIDTGYNVNEAKSTINAYVGYLEAAPTYKHLFGPGILGSNVTASPMFLRVKYDKANSHWWFGYKFSETGPYSWVYDFIETAALPGLPSGINFNISHIGVFAGASGTNPPGFTSKVDYIKVTSDANTDDAYTINVTKNGSGSVNWPMTNPAQQCVSNVSGDKVNLEATPDSGATFNGWSGDVTSASQTIQLTMNKAYNLIANFSGGAPVVFDHFYFLPFTSR